METHRLLTLPLMDSLQSLAPENPHIPLQPITIGAHHSLTGGPSFTVSPSVSIHPVNGIHPVNDPRLHTPNRHYHPLSSLPSTPPTMRCHLPSCLVNHVVTPSSTSESTVSTPSTALCIHLPNCPPYCHSTSLRSTVLTTSASVFPTGYISSSTAPNRDAVELSN
jgi:hypothetical protein